MGAASAATGARFGLAPRRRAQRFLDLVFSIEAAGALQRLSIRRLRAIDRLTPRESDVARAFSSGQSYKEVARALQLSPATVRHYLREIYIKLGLTDKAELASLLNAP